MSKPLQRVEIVLQPGELYFGDRNTRIRTLLGSCVAVTLWHPYFLIGGMCHYLLPGRRLSARNHTLDGRYADDAFLMFLRELQQNGTKPSDYEVKMFGGGNQFPEHATDSLSGIPDSVPDKNIIAGCRLLIEHGFSLKAQHMGGSGHRNVIFDVGSGHVWMEYVEKS